MLAAITRPAPSVLTLPQHTTRQEMHMTSKYKLLFSAMALVISGSAVAGDSITIATDATFPPFESVDASGKLVGYDIEL
eukprot:gene311-438_t